MLIVAIAIIFYFQCLTENRASTAVNFPELIHYLSKSMPSSVFGLEYHDRTFMESRVQISVPTPTRVGDLPTIANAIERLTGYECLVGDDFLCVVPAEKNLAATRSFALRNVHIQKKEAQNSYDIIENITAVETSDKVEFHR